MTRIVWACFDGGGNVPPSLGIAQVLTARGHEVVFAGRPEMVGRVEPAGFPAVELTRAYTHADRYAWHPRGRLFSYLTSPAVGDELLALVEQRRPDLVVIDAMFGAALAVRPRLGVPTAVMLHTFLHRTLAGWRVMMRGQSEARRASGFGPLPDLEELWSTPELLQVNALEEFDSDPVVDWKNVRHGGPVLEDDPRSTQVGSPTAGEGSDPLVLVSFSTALAQLSIGKLQRTLDALAGLPVRAVVTLGAAVEPEQLHVGDNTRAVQFAFHDPLMQAASLVVTHGGHGTAMRALRHEAPVLCLTGRASDQDGVAALDQPCVAAFLEERGAGRSLPADASAAEIRAVVRDMLDDRCMRASARRLAVPLRRAAGALAAADNLATLLGPA